MPASNARIALLPFLPALLVALACGESPTEVGATVTADGARLTIESPVADEVIGEHVVLLKGSAFADGNVASVRVSRHYVYPNGSVGPDSSWYIRNAGGPGPLGGLWDWKNTGLQFSTSFPADAGSLVIKVELDYRPQGARDDPHYLTYSVPIRVYRKPTISAVTSFPDTLYQRSLKLTATTRGLVAQPKMELSMDGGAPVTPASVVSRINTADSIVWGFDFPDTLANGRHTLKLRLLDELGPTDSVSRTFVTSVADAPYSVLALPGQGGSDADAFGLNANGDVAGWAKDAGGIDRAMLWRSGTAQVLPIASTARSSRAYSINDAADVVGFVNDTSGTAYCDRGVLWRGSTWTFVGVGANLCGQQVKLINANADMLIASPCCTYPSDLFGWVLHASGVTDSLFDVQGREMNGRALVVGTQILGGLYTTYGTTDYGPPVKYPTFRSLISGGRVTPGDKYSINETGQIVGVFNNTLYFSADPAVEAIDLNPYLGPAQFTSVAVPVHVTNNATILAFHDAIKTAFLWRNGKTTRVKLTTPGYTLDRVKSMNDRGQIIGHAIETGTGIGRAVLLNPAP